MFRALPGTILFALTALSPLAAGELYYTGFENFTTGSDTITGTDGWTGSGPHAGLQLSGVDTEADHLVAGIGNAAYIGGNTTPLPAGTSRTVNVRRAFTVDHATPGQEVVQFRVNVGIKDSTSGGFLTRRDNFEFAFYNQDPVSRLIGFIQFDNTTMSTATQAPAQKIWRSSYSGTALGKVDTGFTFLYDVLMELVVRINFRTNRWTASLDGLPVFADVPFYTGPYTKNLGLVAAQMYIANTFFDLRTGQTVPTPGQNYMLFDDFAVRLDPPAATLIWDFSRNAATGATRISWLTEAAYHYQLQYTDNLTQPWKNDLPGSFMTAANTGQSPVFTDTSAPGKPNRFYRVAPSDPNP